MGYTTILDILSAMFIGGMLMLSLQQVNYNAVTNLGYYTADYLLQLDLLEAVRLIETDLKRIGYSKKPGQIPSNYDAIIQADSESIAIVGDFIASSSSKVDTVRYYLGPVSEMAATPNPRDRNLYRKVNSLTPQRVDLSITEFKLMYLNAINDTISFPIPRAETGGISCIQVSVRAESPDTYTEQLYSRSQNTAGDRVAEVYWRQIRLAARNLQNR